MKPECLLNMQIYEFLQVEEENREKATESQKLSFGGTYIKFVCCHGNLINNKQTIDSICFV